MFTSRTMKARQLQLNLAAPQTCIRFLLNSNARVGLQARAACKSYVTQNQDISLLIPILGSPFHKLTL